jgi:hypothetical protein
MIAPNRASSSEKDVSMRQAGGGTTELRMSRHTETPSPSGRRTSRMATSGRSAGDPGTGLGGGAGLADDLDVVLGFQQLRDAAPDDLVVVEQEHRDRQGLSLLGCAWWHRAIRTSTTPG